MGLTLPICGTGRTIYLSCQIDQMISNMVFSLKSEDVKISQGADSQRGGVGEDSEDVHRGGAPLLKGFLRGFVGVAVHG